MQSFKHSNTVLTVSALFFAIAIPSLVFGRAVLGGSLFISLVLACLVGNHSGAWAILKSYASRKFGYLLGFVAFATALNIPFSLRLGLSFEAWSRTWILLLLLIYLMLLLRSHVSFILKTLTLSLSGVLFLGTVGLLAVGKPEVNGYLLALPLCFYFCVQSKNKRWWGVGAFLFVAYIGCALVSVSKASLIGFMLMLLCTGLFVGLQRYSKLKVIISFCILIPLLAGILSYWAESNLNMSSWYYADVAPLPVFIIDLHRQLIWLFSFDLIKLSPFVGFGLNASNYHEMAQMTVQQYFGPQFDKVPAVASVKVLPAHPHNWFVELMLDAGLIGLFSVVSCVCAIFYSSIKQFFCTNNTVFLAFIALNLGYWGTGLLNFSFWSVWWQACYFLPLSLFLMSQQKGAIDEA